MKPVRLGLVLVVTLIVPACAPEGAGSIHADRAGTSSIMVTPDRRAHVPSQPKTRAQRTTPNATSPGRSAHSLESTPSHVPAFCGFKRLHPDRIARRHRHHRRANRSAVARGAAGS